VGWPLPAYGQGFIPVSGKWKCSLKRSFAGQKQRRHLLKKAMPCTKQTEENGGAHSDCPGALLLWLQYPLSNFHALEKPRPMILQPPTMEALYTVQEWEELLPLLSPEMLMEVSSIVLADMACYSPTEKYFLMHLFTHSMQQRLLDVAFPMENSML
jgi:hypothetical protein